MKKTALFASAASVEYATGGMLIPAMEAMNQTIVQQAFDLEGQQGTLEEVAVAYRENLIDEYITENGNPEEERGVLTWEDKVNGTFTTTYKNWRNYLVTYYSFRGGAHGVQTVSQLVFDKKTGKVLTQEELFADDFAQPVALLMREAIKEDMEAEDAILLLKSLPERRHRRVVRPLPAGEDEIAAFDAPGLLNVVDDDGS